jgi:hydroxymethylpyrimidine kinase/phosphomethylpyrimidine kinase
VRVATVGTQTGLLRDEAREVVLRELLPLATLVTPNLREAAWLTGREVGSLPQMRDAAQALVDLGAPAVLVKGGHLAFRSDHPAIDVLLLDGSLHELHAERVVTQAGHGTGCSLASAIAARLALGEPLQDAVILGKEWVRRGLVSAPPLGGGAWPIDHFAAVPERKPVR